MRDAVKEFNEGVKALAKDIERRTGVKIPIAKKEFFKIQESAIFEVRDKNTNELKVKKEVIFNNEGKNEYINLAL